MFWRKLRQGCRAWQRHNCQRHMSQARVSFGEPEAVLPTLKVSGYKGIMASGASLCSGCPYIQAMHSRQGRLALLFLLHVTTSGKIITGKHTPGLSISQAPLQSERKKRCCLLPGTVDRSVAQGFCLLREIYCEPTMCQSVRARGVNHLQKNVQWVQPRNSGL